MQIGHCFTLVPDDVPVSLYFVCVVVQLDVLVNFGLLGTVLWEYWCMLTGGRPDDAFNLEQYHVHLEAIVQSAFAGQSLHLSGLEAVGAKHGVAFSACTNHKVTLPVPIRG
jgi:hypothetical protein